MAEKRKEEEEVPAISSQNLGEKKSDSDKVESEDSTSELETSRRESKKRRKCPAALDNFQEFENHWNRNCFSFSFDTKISSSGGTPESTPKFGSFNLAGELGLLNSSSTTTITQQQQQQQQEEKELEEFDLLGFSEINKGEEDNNKKKKNSIPIVVKSSTD